MSTSNAAVDEFASHLATNIRTLMRLRGITAVQAYERIHVSSGTWFSHMNTGSWSARQIAELADMLDVPIEILYGDPNDLIRTGRFATPFGTIAGGADVDAPRRGHLRVLPGRGSGGRP